MSSVSPANSRGRSPADTVGGGLIARADTATLLMLALLAAAFLGVFFRWFLKQHQFSANHLSDWGHAYIVPAVVGYLIWHNRAALKAARPEVFWPALTPFVLGICAYFFFIVGVPNHMLQGASMILAIFGLTLLLLGPQVMRVLALPIAYLGFGVTVSQQVMEQITFFLQQLAAVGSGVVLQVAGAIGGFDVEVSGNIIIVADHPLNVAEACSGMRMVVAFLALGAAVALVACPHWWQRVWVIALAVPVAVVLNIVRVVILGGLSLVDPDLATGEAHTFIGTLLLVPGLGLFLLVVWILNRVVIDAPAPRKGGAA